jgi:hypothetical protein
MGVSSAHCRRPLSLGAYCIQPTLLILGGP